MEMFQVSEKIPFDRRQSMWRQKYRGQCPLLFHMQKVSTTTASLFTRHGLKQFMYKLNVLRKNRIIDIDTVFRNHVRDLSRRVGYINCDTRFLPVYALARIFVEVSGANVLSLLESAFCTHSQKYSTCKCAHMPMR